MRPTILNRVRLWRFAASYPSGGWRQAEALGKTPSARRNQQKFAYTHASTGLEYLRARYYDPATGRFLSLDPLGDGYDYAYDNPVMFTDPSGLRPLDPGSKGCQDMRRRISELGDRRIEQYWRGMWQGVYDRHCGGALMAPGGPTESVNGGGRGNAASPRTPAYRAAISGPFDEGTAPRCAQYDLNCDGRLSRLEIRIFCKRNALSPFCEGELLDKVYECVKLGKCDNGLSPEVKDCIKGAIAGAAGGGAVAVFTGGSAIPIGAIGGCIGNTVQNKLDEWWP